MNDSYDQRHFVFDPSVVQPIQNAEFQECIDGISSTLNGQFNGLKSNVKVTLNSWNMVFGHDPRIHMLSYTQMSFGKIIKSLSDDFYSQKGQRATSQWHHNAKSKKAFSGRHSVLQLRNRRGDCVHVSHLVGYWTALIVEIFCAPGLDTCVKRSCFTIIASLQ